LARWGESMVDIKLIANLALLLVCYAYIFVVILASERIDRVFDISRKYSRKFLHIMIGNLPLLIPFFSLNSFPMNFPFYVAAPFILITFLASPYSPENGLRKKLAGLAGITGEGHQLGLILYAVSYSILALFFSAKPYVIAAGILPMAYGDASASLVGERYGKSRYSLFAKKSLEGSVAMFFVSLLAFALSLLFFSVLYPISIYSLMPAIVGVAFVTTLAEGLSPLGFDNITVPILGALAFLLIGGGI
jgi:phytol kinase